METEKRVEMEVSLDPASQSTVWRWECFGCGRNSTGFSNREYAVQKWKRHQRDCDYDNR